MYRRFSTMAFEPCMEPDCPSALIYQAVMSEGQGAAIPTTASVNALLDSKMLQQTKAKKAATIRPGGWSQTIRPFNLPYGMDIVLGDVCGGSSSTSMVSLHALLFLVRLHLGVFEVRRQGIAIHLGDQVSFLPP
jgi:hypothetical protein